MDIKAVIKLASRELKRNKSRSFLTMLGIIIGVFAVITLVSVGTGLKAYITTQFESLGANVLYIMPGKVGDGESGFGGSHGAPNFSGSKLKFTMIRDIEKIGEPISDADGIIELPANAKFGNNKKSTTVIGSTEKVFSLMSLKTTEGRFFNANEISSSKKVAVVGPELQKKLYGVKDALNQEIIVNDERFKIVGILESKGAGIVGGMADNTVYIPITTAQKLFGTESLQEILVRFADKDKLEEAKFKIRALLLKSMKEDDFSIVNQASILSTISSILSTLTIALGGIAAVSLLVGGIGIMNIMLVSVTERTREIGIRKSVGAKNSDILAQFVTEAVFLSLIGGIIGVLLGVVGAIVIGKLINANALTWWSVVLALGVSSLIGIIFGVAPAAKAAKLNPVDALRYE